MVVTRQPDGSLAAFHNVCQHRGPAIVGASTGCGARRFTCPYHGWVYDTKGVVVGVPEREDFDPAHLEGVRAPAVAADEWGGWVWINMAGPDAGDAAHGGHRRGDLGRPRPLQDGGHDPARRARVGRAGQLQGDRRRLQRDLPHQATARRRPGVVEGGAQHVVPHRRRQLHVLRAAGRSPRGVAGRPRPPPHGDLPLRRVPEHGVQLQPRTHPGVQPDPDRRRPDPLPVLGADLPGRPRRSRVRDRISTGR